MCSGPINSKEDYKYDEYAVKSAVDCLMRAEDIKKDEKMMKLVKEQLGKQQKAIRSIADIKEASAKMDEKKKA